ncbi:sensor histidine kinase [Spirosoma panaciterrae]|uniref:sensor histidine kinase n=1 Tax=Spirosoma panaciterrae TaxID=496058 RepID=UPI00036D0B32|nr:sensor histidine kinase [Spirosoma panaciterrae]
MPSSPPPDVVLVILVGTLLLLILAGFITSIIFLYKQRHKAQQQEMTRLQEAYQRELLQSQIEIQNQTLQQIAQDLHDNIGQLLTVVTMRLNTLEDDVQEPDTQQAVQQTRDLVKTIIQEVRMLSKSLNQDVVGRFGLLPSLTHELERIERSGKIKTTLLTQGEPYSLGEKTEIVLLRMAQESLNNALKHARPRHLTLITDYRPDAFILTIADDGRGFDVEEAKARDLKQTGSGLYNLYHRSALLKGTCTITSQPGQGTQIEIRLPAKQPLISSPALVSS